MGHVFCTYMYFSGEGIVVLYAAPNPFLLNEICLKPTIPVASLVFLLPLFILNLPVLSCDSNIETSLDITTYLSAVIYKTVS